MVGEVLPWQSASQLTEHEQKRLRSSREKDHLEGDKTMGLTRDQAHGVGKRGEGEAPPAPVECGKNGRVGIAKVLALDTTMSARRDRPTS